MNFIRNQDFRAGSEAGLKGFVCLPQKHNQSKSRVFSRSGGNGLQLDKKLTPKNVIRSLYSANTLKGEKLIDIVNQKLYYQELSTEQAFVQDAVCYKIRPIPAQRDMLYSSLNKMEYGELVESIFHCNLPMNHKTFSKWYWTNEVKNHIKRILFFYKYYKKWKENKL